MKEKTEEQKEILWDYKNAERKYCGRTINDCLRNEESITDTFCKEEINKVVSALEELMYTPNVLYRALDNTDVRVEDGIICDKAFLSTSSDINYLMGFTATNMAILVIKNCADIPSIDVVEILGNQNNEHEFILPRNLPLRVRGIQNYSQKDFTRFLIDNNLQEDISARELIDIKHINTITVYEVEPYDNTMKQIMSAIREFKKSKS